MNTALAPMSIAFNNKGVIPKDPWQRPGRSNKEETLRVWGRRVSLPDGVFGSVGVLAVLRPD
jgi:hypothetical protein